MQSFCPDTKGISVLLQFSKFSYDDPETAVDTKFRILKNSKDPKHLELLVHVGMFQTKKEVLCRLTTGTGVTGTADKFTLVSDSQVPDATLDFLYKKRDRIRIFRILTYMYLESLHNSHRILVRILRIPTFLVQSMYSEVPRSTYQLISN